MSSSLIISNVLEYMNRAHLISDFIKKKSPQPGLEPTKMRQYLKNSMSPLHECFSRMKIEVINFSKAYKNTQSTSLSKWDWNGSNLNGKEQFQNYGLTIKKECETKRYKGKTCCIIILMQIIGAHTTKIALQTSLKTSFVEWCFIYIVFEAYLKLYWIFHTFSISLFWACWQFTGQAML